MSWWRDILSYNRSQKRALLFLWSVILVVLISDYVFHQKLIQTSITPKLDTLASIKIKPIVTAENKVQQKVRPRAFNPNTDPLDTLLAKGIPGNIAHRIVKLRDYGKIFAGPEDLKMLYGMNDSLLNILLPYAIFPKTSKPKPSQNQIDQPILLTGFFDPNISTMEQMENIGLPKSIAKSIRRYVERGGKFKTPDELKKIYNIDSAMLIQILPYVKIELSEPLEIKIINAELNTAGFNDLKKVLNTDNKHVAQIINYRGRLGGYYSHEQLNEIQGLPQQLLEQIKEKCWIDTIQIDKIDINQANFSTLLSHPYLEKSDVDKIMRYRNFAKTISSIQELIKNKVISKETATRIAPYIKFN